MIEHHARRTWVEQADPRGWLRGGGNYQQGGEPPNNIGSTGICQLACSLCFVMTEWLPVHTVEGRVLTIEALLNVLNWFVARSWASGNTIAAWTGEVLGDKRGGDGWMS